MISIILSNYNDSSVIQGQLTSIVNQTVFPAEVILADDGSTDGSKKILTDFAQRYFNQNIKLMLNNRNRGFEPCVNDGIAISTQPYLYFCASDDRLKSNFIENLSKLCEDSPAVVMDSKDLARGNYPDLGESGMIRNFTHGNCYIPGHASIIRKDIMEEFEGHRKDFLWHADHFLFHAAAFKYGMASTGETSADKYNNPNSYCNLGVETDEQIKVLNAMVEELDKPIYDTVRDHMMCMVRKLPRGNEI